MMLGLLVFFTTYIKQIHFIAERHLAPRFNAQYFNVHCLERASVIHTFANVSLFCIFYIVHHAEIALVTYCNAC